MSLRLKLFAPLVALSLGFMVYLQHGWLPHLIADERTEYAESARHWLTGLAEEVAAVHRRSGRDGVRQFLETALKKREGLVRFRVLSGTGAPPVVGAPQGEAAAELLKVVVPLGQGAAVRRLEAGFDWDRIESRRRSNHRLLLAFLVGGALAYLLLTALVAEFGMVRPLNQLGRATRRMAEGDFGAELPPARDDEVGLLIRDFDAMRHAVEQHRDALEQARHSLEGRVEARTAELERTNRQLVEEVEERKRTEQRLRRTVNELELQKFALDQHSVVAITDREGRITYVNDRFCSLSQYDREELIGATHGLVNSGYHLPGFFTGMWATITSGRVWHGELRNRRKDGGYYWVDTSIVPFCDDDGQVYQYVSISTDISERVRAQLEQQERQERLSQQQHALLGLARTTSIQRGLEEALAEIQRAAMETLDLARSGIWFFREGGEALVRHRCARETGAADDGPQTLRRADHPGYFELLQGEALVTVEDASAEPALASVLALLPEDLAAGARIDVPIRRGGVMVGVLCLARAAGRWHRDEQNFAASLADMVGVALEQDTRREVEEALRDSEQRFKAIAENMSDWIWEVGPDYAYQYGSGKLRELLGYGLNEIMGRHPFEFMEPGEAERARAAFDAARAGDGRLRELEHCRLTRDGRRVWLSSNAVALYEDDGAFAGFLGVDADITERKRAEQELEAARDAALEASRAKSEFIAMVSHEIRTPMNGVLGMLDLLRETPLNREQSDYMETAASSAELLLTLLNDILDYSRVELEAVELNERAFEPRRLISEVCDLAAGRLQETAVTLDYRVDGSVPQEVVADGSRVRQVLSNLVGNAVKFTERGSIYVQAVLESGHGGAATLRLSVADTGIGIDPAAIDQVFDSFAQADSSTTRRYGGAGLGLAVSNRLVERMGGQIACESQPGEGSTFTVTLPVTAAAPVRERLLDLSGRRVALVTAGGKLEEVLTYHFQQWGAEVLAAAHARHGAAVVEQELAAGRTIDLVVAESGLVDGDALDLGDRIGTAVDRRDLPFLVLRPFGQNCHNDRCDEVSVDACVTRPVDERTLAGEVARLLGMGVPLRWHAPEGTAEGGDPAVLVVAGSRLSRGLIKAMLDHLGVGAVTVAEAARARQVLEQDARNIGLVIVDSPSPGAVDAETVSVLRRQGAGRQRPVVAVLPEGGEAREDTCLAAGMEEAMTKPIRMAGLLKLVDRWLPGRGATAEQSSGPERGRVDGDQIGELAELMADDLEALLGAYFEDAPGHLERISRALEEGDWPVVAEAAHTLKGSSANIGARVMKRLAAELQRAAESESVERTTALFASLEAEWPHTQAALREATASRVPQHED